MKLSFYIRNHWKGWSGDNFYWLGFGYAYQGPQLIVWHLWLAGFCACLFIDRQGTSKYPRPLPSIPSTLYRKWKHRKL